MPRAKKAATITAKAVQDGRLAAGYLRVSTAKQVKNTSLGSQDEGISEYVERGGWQLVELYCDRGRSGADPTRPALEQMMADARSGRFGTLVVKKFDRLGRNLAHTASLLRQLRDLGITIVSVDESVDTTTTAGQLMVNMILSFAEFEREQIKERTQAGVEAVIRQGFWPGGPAPFGYRLVRGDAHTRIEEDPDEAETLRMAATWFGIEGLSLTETAERLNSIGQQTRKGLDWSRQTLRWLFETSPMGGEWGWSPETHRHSATARMMVAVPALVSPDVVEAVARRLDEDSTGKRPGAYDYLLTGRLRSLCGDLYTGAGHPTMGPGYKCRRLDRAHAGRDEPCGCKRIPAEFVEGPVWEAVVELLSDPDRIYGLAAEWMVQAQAEASVRGESLAVVQRRLDRLQAGLKEKIRSYLKAGVDPQMVRAYQDETLAEIDQLAAYRDRLAAVEARPPGPVRDLEWADRVAEWAQGELVNADRTARHKVIDLLGAEVALTEWTTCPRCAGRGKVSGPRHGRSCPECRGTRHFPVLTMTGDIGLLQTAVGDSGDAGQLAAPVAAPFQVEIRSA